jgi:hypothetical protein
MYFNLILNLVQTDIMYYYKHIYIYIYILLCNMHVMYICRIPHEQNIRESWISNMQKSYVIDGERNFSEHTYVCCLHFDNSCLQLQSSGRITLCPGSIPTLFGNNSFTQSISQPVSMPVLPIAPSVKRIRLDKMESRRVFLSSTVLIIYRSKHTGSDLPLYFVPKT